MSKSPPSSNKKPASPLKRALASRLRALQHELHETDEGMAKRLKITRSAWSNWIGIKTGNMPAEEAIITLCDEFGLTMDWFYRGDTKQLPLALAIRLTAWEKGMNPDEAQPEQMAEIASGLAHTALTKP